MWQLRPGVSWTATEYGGVLLDATSGDYWTLNHTGAAVIASIVTDGGTDGVAARLAADFDADHDDIAGDVSSLVGELEAARLVVRR
ncbi:hypothetical protein Q0Z83_064740 [Actinoplanes sichuanensis]|nr:hypothetical protein Q0Z83_064740 [Actinoplanes sichuanensis]